MLWKNRWFYLFLLNLAACLSLGLTCDFSGEPTEDAKTLFYVLDNTNNAVYVVENATTADGPQDPVRTISGDNTLIENPTAIAVDGRRDILYVLDTQQLAVLVFAPASQKDGDVEPTRSFPAGVNPQAMSLDVAGNRLYVSDIAEQEILVWNTVSSVDNEVPDNTFTLGFAASGIFIDNERDLLYVGDPAFKAIQVFAQASTTIGDASPVATITDADLEFTLINSLGMNVDTDVLYVAESQNPSVEIFDNASTLDGDITPDRSLEGDATDFTAQMRHLLFLDDVLYISPNDTQIGAGDDANTVDGDVAPNRLITVNGATRIKSFDIDLLH